MSNKTTETSKPTVGTVVIAIALILLLLFGPGLFLAWLVMLVLVSFGVVISFWKVWAALIVAGMVFKYIKD